MAQPGLTELLSTEPYASGCTTAHTWRLSFCGVLRILCVHGYNGNFAFLQHLPCAVIRVVSRLSLGEEKLISVETGVCPQGAPIEPMIVGRKGAKFGYPIAPR